MNIAHMKHYKDAINIDTHDKGYRENIQQHQC